MLVGRALSPEDEVRRQGQASYVEGWGAVSTVELIFAVGWAVFWLYWLVAAFSVKRGHLAWSRELRIRALIIGVVIVLVRLGVFRGTPQPQH